MREKKLKEKHTADYGGNAQGRDSWPSPILPPHVHVKMSAAVNPLARHVEEAGDVAWETQSLPSQSPVVAAVTWGAM